MLITLELEEKDVKQIAAALHRFDLTEVEYHKDALKIGNEIAKQLTEQKNTGEVR